MKKSILNAGLFVAPIGAATFVTAGGAAIYGCTRQRNHGRLRKGRVAIITGSSSGLGLALAHRLGRAGLKLVLAAGSREQLEEARHELLESGSITSEADVLIVNCDLTDQKQAATLINTALQVFGTLDVLINNAGVIEVRPVEDQPLSAYEQAMAINFFGALYTTYAALPTLLKKREGSIVNISSIGGKMAVPHLLPYVASKFASLAFPKGCTQSYVERECASQRYVPALSGQEARATPNSMARSIRRRGGFKQPLARHFSPRAPSMPQIGSSALSIQGEQNLRSPRRPGWPFALWELLRAQLKL